MSDRPDATRNPAAAILYRLEWLDEAARITSGVLAVVAKFAHYKTFPEKKIGDALRTELPGAYVFLRAEKDYSSLGVVFRIEADSRPTGRPIPYDDRIHVLSYPERERALGGETWAEQIRRSLAGFDLPGQRARLEIEQAKLGHLAALAKRLAAQVATAQEEARTLLGLADGVGPSAETSKAFPALF
jgi:hypothetical protein